MVNTSILNESKKKSVVLNIIKGSFWGVAFSLVGVLIFAFIIKFTQISESTIAPVNQIIKALSIFFALFVVRKNIQNQGWLVGMIIGLLYTALAFIIFSILDGSFNFGINILNDLVFGAVMGLISGIICIGLRKK